MQVTYLCELVFIDSHEFVSLHRFIMNKQALVDIVNEEIDGTKVQAESIVNLIFDTITKTLKEGNEVSLAGFGSFIPQQRAARTARNPRTGETVQVPAKVVPKFKAAKALKDAVAGI